MINSSVAFVAFKLSEERQNDILQNVIITIRGKEN